MKFDSEYDNYAPFWETIYEKKEDDFPFYHMLAQTVGSPVLDVGCGTARIGLLLAKAGYEVHNLDISESMLGVARDKAAREGQEVQRRLHFVYGDMRTFQLDRTFPLITSTFSTMFAFKSTADFVSAASNIKNHLEKDGTFAFDVTFFGKGKYKNWGPRQIEDNSPRLMKVVADRTDPEKKWVYTRIVAVDDKNKTRKIIAFFDGIKNSLVVERRVFDLSNIYLPPVDLRARLKDAGFKKIAIFGGLDRKPLYHPSYVGKQRQVVIARI